MTIARSVTNLLATSKYLGDEAGNLLYGSAVFKLTPAKVSAFSSSSVFCKIKRISLMFAPDLHHDGPAVLHLAHRFIREAATHAPRTQGESSG